MCHSAQREVEVLQDHLLSIFEEDPSLTPRDVIVMVADIDSYAPYIQAVFGNTTSSNYIPFSISDRKALQAHPILQAFITLLDLPQSRFSTEQVLSLLEVKAFSQHFGTKLDIFSDGQPRKQRILLKHHAAVCIWTRNRFSIDLDDSVISAF